MCGPDRRGDIFFCKPKCQRSHRETPGEVELNSYKGRIRDAVRQLVTREYVPGLLDDLLRLLLVSALVQRLRKDDVRLGVPWPVQLRLSEEMKEGRSIYATVRVHQKHLRLQFKTRKSIQQASWVHTKKNIPRNDNPLSHTNIQSTSKTKQIQNKKIVQTKHVKTENNKQKRQPVMQQP